MIPRPSVFDSAALLAALALLTVLAPVAAHADLERSDPAADTTVEGTPPEVSGVFTESLDSATSRILLLDESGQRLAEGGMDPDDDSATTMRLDPPALAPGTYEVRWTARTPDDGAVTRGRWTFTVAQAATGPGPTNAETPGSSPAASPPDSSRVPGQPRPSTAPTAPPVSAPPSPEPGPSPSTVTPDGTGPDPLGGVAVPLLALAAVAAAAVVLLTRRPR